MDSLLVNLGNNSNDEWEGICNDALLNRKMIIIHPSHILNLIKAARMNQKHLDELDLVVSKMLNEDSATQDIIRKIVSEVKGDL